MNSITPTDFQKLFASDNKGCGYVLPKGCNIDPTQPIAVNFKHSWYGEEKEHTTFELLVNSYFDRRNGSTGTFYRVKTKV